MTHCVVDCSAGFFGALLVVAMGAFVLTVKPRTAPTTWFGIFALSWGTFFLVNNGSGLFHPPPAVTLVVLVPLQVPLQGLAIVAIVALALVFPRPLGAEERRLAMVPLVVAAVAFVPGVVAALTEATYPTFWHLASRIGTELTNAALYGYLVLLALRLRAADDPAFRRQVALTAAALTLYIGYQATFGFYFGGSNSLLTASGWTLARSGVNSVILLGVTSVYLASLARPDGHLARNLAWLTLGTMLAGLLMAAGPAPTPGGHGVVRTLLAFVLAYAITRHQLLGIDVKIRFALSKSTIAAVFIAVFFLASEAAQQFFGEAFQSAYVGIAAAGALVFAMAPLQRAAERIAERAVPSPSIPPPSSRPASFEDRHSAPEREVAYREAVRLATRDRVITREEERHLLRLAHHAGIPPPRALEIHDEVERETGGRA